MKIIKYISKSLAVLLVFLCNTQVSLGNMPSLSKCEKCTPEIKAVPLYGGCAEPFSQTVFYGDLPQYIYASPASGGNCSGNYVYQWQWSADNIYFVDIPNTNDQRLYFTNEMNLSTNQPLPQTIYVQRKTICGAEVQFTNSVSITYVNSVTIYARLEINLSDSTFYNDGEFMVSNKMVSGYVRFYSDDACTIPYNVPANINYSIRQCSHYESGNTVTDGCSLPEHFQGITYVGEHEAWLDDILGWEYYEMMFNWNTGEWEFSVKGWDDYELVSADNCIIKPPVYPPHSSGYGYYE
jgi:hypothetical protein